MTTPSPFPPMDDLDRLIEDAARDMAAGEPKRVSAASIREAMSLEAPRRIGLPVWMGLAAVLVVGLLVTVMRDRGPQASPVTTSARPASLSQPAMSPSPSPLTTTTATTAAAVHQRVVTDSSRPAPRARRALAADVDEHYEGLPRLVVPLIERPEPLATTALMDPRLEFPRIDIAPLQLSALDPEQR